MLEFTAAEGNVYLPHWMMNNLLLEEGSVLSVRNVSLPKAKFVKFKPQHVDFLDISNPRAVLEKQLRMFSCVTVGDQICLPYNNRRYYLEVQEVKPRDAACIIECDCNVDFDAPVGYKEPDYKAQAQAPKANVPAPQKAKSQAREEEENKPTESFKAFAGGGQRLDGKEPKGYPSAARSPGAQAADDLNSPRPGRRRARPSRPVPWRRPRRPKKKPAFRRPATNSEKGQNQQGGLQRERGTRPARSRARSMPVFGSRRASRGFALPKRRGARGIVEHAVAARQMAPRGRMVHAMPGRRRRGAQLIGGMPAKANQKRPRDAAARLAREPARRSRSSASVSSTSAREIGLRNARSRDNI